MARMERYDLFARAILDDSVPLTESQRAELDRIKDAYTYWLDKPMLSEKDIRDYLIVRHGMSKTQAYDELTFVKLLLGNVTLAAKNWWRFKVNAILDTATKAAEAGDTAKAKALQKIAESYIKNNRCNTDDGERLPWEEIKPKDWSFSVDPAVAGVKVDPKLRERAAALKKKYLQEADAEEVEATVVPEDHR